jgi:hypothetical protein
MFLIWQGSSQRGTVIFVSANDRNEMIRRLIEKSQEMMNGSR